MGKLSEMTVGKSLRIFLTALLCHGSVAAFYAPQPVHHRGAPSVVCLQAKNNKSRISGSTSKGGGGFGSSKNKITTIPTESTSKPGTEQGDYAAFPQLESHVQATLLPSLDVETSGPLPSEMYDRIHQIYGFPNFNYEILSSNDDTPSTNILASLAQVGDTTNEEKQRQLSDSLSKLPEFDKFRILHIDPMVLAIDEFFTTEECDQFVALASQGAADRMMDNNQNLNSNAPYMTRSKTVGKDSVAKSQRTSTTWFHHFYTVPELMAKATRLLGLDTISRWEEPQTVR